MQKIINIVMGHAIPFPPSSGGIEKAYFSLAKEFSKAGIKVIIYSKKEKGLPEFEIDEFGINHRRVKGYNWKKSIIFNLIDSFRWCLKLRGKIGDGDIIMHNSFWAFLLLKKKKYGVSTCALHRYPSKFKLITHKGFIRVYCHSDSVIETSLKIYPKIKNLKRIYSPISVPLECPEKPPANNGLIFKFIGRFAQEKGLEFLIKGFAKSLKNYPENRLVIVGPTSKENGGEENFYNEMRSYINDVGLQDKVFIKPPVFDSAKVVDEIMSCDVFCNPSISGEAFSQAILEALAMGRPVLTSDFGPNPEQVDHKKNGYIATASSIDSINDGIVFFSENISELEKMGYSSWRKAHDFSVEKIASQYIEDFDFLLK